MGAVKNLVEKGSTKVSVIGAVTGAGIDTISATRDERAFLSDLIEEYRPEIAKRLGLAEKQVSAEHFKSAFRENPVLAQAKQATRMTRTVRAVSNAVSVAVGLVAGLAASMFVRKDNSKNTGNGGKAMQENAADIAGALAATFSGMFAGKLTRRVLHMRGREDSLIDTAHGQIMVIKNKQQLGESTDAADIFKVQLAVNTEVGQAIRKAYGKGFNDMQSEEQHALLQSDFPEVLAANNEMARRINEGARPQGLLFADVEDVKAKQEEKKALQHPEEITAKAPVPETVEKQEGQLPVHGPQLPSAEEKVALLRQLQEEDGLAGAILPVPPASEPVKAVAEPVEAPAKETAEPLPHGPHTAAVLQAREKAAAAERAV